MKIFARQLSSSRIDAVYLQEQPARVGVTLRCRPRGWRWCSFGRAAAADGAGAAKGWRAEGVRAVPVAEAVRVYDHHPLGQGDEGEARAEEQLVDQLDAGGLARPGAQRVRAPPQGVGEGAVAHPASSRNSSALLGL